MTMTMTILMTTSPETEQAAIPFPVQVVTTPIVLKQALSRVLPAIPKKSSLPILEHLHIVAQEDGTIVLHGTNLEVSLTVRIKGRVAVPGEMCIPAQLLTASLTTLTKYKQTREQPITLTYDASTCTIMLMADGHSESLCAGDPGKYPLIPALPASPSQCDVFSLPVAEFRHLVQATTYAVDTDWTRPILAGVSLRRSYSGLTKESFLDVFGANAYRIAHTTVPVKRHGLDAFTPYLPSVLMPATSLTLLMKANMLPTTGHVTCTIDAKSSTLFLACDSLLCVTRLIESTPPNYYGLVPSQHTRIIVAPLEGLLRAYELAAPKVKEASNITRLTIQKEEETGAMTVSVYATAEEVGKSDGHIAGATVTVVSSTHYREPESESYLMNVKYVLEALNAMKQAGATQVEIAVSVPTRPVLLRPVSETTTGWIMPRCESVIMPMSPNC